MARNAAAPVSLASSDNFQKCRRRFSSLGEIEGAEKKLLRNFRPDIWLELLEIPAAVLTTTRMYVL